MAITTISDRKTDISELVEVTLEVFSSAIANFEKLAANMAEMPAKLELSGRILFKFFNSFDLTNNIC
jgi:hypothetical protein